MASQESVSMMELQAVGKSGFDASQELIGGDLGVFGSEKGLPEHTLIVHLMNLNQSHTEALTRRLREVFGQFISPM